MRGVYSLVMNVKGEFNVGIGALGDVSFPRGTYVYVGSALNSLEMRIARHLEREKKKHWNIDYLTTSSKVEIKHVAYAYSNSNLECRLSKSISNLPFTRPIPKFGASDCTSGCTSHLYLANTTESALLASLREAMKKMNVKAKIKPVSRTEPAQEWLQCSPLNY